MLPGLLQPAAQSVRHAELVVEYALVPKLDFLLLAIVKRFRQLVLGYRLPKLLLIEQAVTEIQVGVREFGQHCRDRPEVALGRGIVLLEVGGLRPFEILLDTWRRRLRLG